MFRRVRSQRGVALLIVVSLLTVMGIIGVAFAFSMFLETQAARQFTAATQARYVAESGVSLARALLDEDRAATRIDTSGELWSAAFEGDAVDVDADGRIDAAWRPAADLAGASIGRYAARVQDESSKANLNAGQAEPPETGAGAINLVTLFAAAGVGDAVAAAAALEAYRYGDDERPGVALVDDDGDGAVDEADEYEPLAPAGDDRRLEGLGDLAAVASFDQDDLDRLRRVATVYSADVNVSLAGRLRINVNTATAEELFDELLEAGVSDPWHAAANMADYVDPDLDISRLTRASESVLMTDQGPLGGWAFDAEPVGHYASDTPGGSLTWTVASGAGRYRLRALGIADQPVGDVTIGGTTRQAVTSGESLGTWDLSQPLEVTVVHPDGEEATCAFRGVELVPEAPVGGTLVRGIEAVRINEIMVEPVVEFSIAEASFNAQGSDWGCPAGQAHCQNGGVGQGRWTWTSHRLAAGRYRVRVFGAASGQTVGQAVVGGDPELLGHGQTHTQTAAVGSDGKFTLTLGKSDADGTYYLARVHLSLQPDGEYVELINLSDAPIDASGWRLEGEATGGRQAQLPAGSVIPAHGVLVAAVDLDDTQPGLDGDGLNAREAWQIPPDAIAVQLVFAGGGPSPDDDWLKATLADGASARLILRAGDAVVDEVEYQLPAPPELQSLEKGDPTAIGDSDNDGTDDLWYPSLRLFTAGAGNDNEGLTEQEGLELVTHDPAHEIAILNRPLTGVGELAGLSSGTAWRPFTSTDLAKVVDRLTVDGLRLETAGALLAGEEDWEEIEGGYSFTGTPGLDTAGLWQWELVPGGEYRLSVYGWSGEQLAVRARRPDSSWEDWSPALTADAQGRVVVGRIRLGDDDAATATLAVQVACLSPGGVCHVSHLWLDPRLVRLGPVNVNTAPAEVLRALPGVTAAVAERLIAGRPYGDRQDKARGIGDLLLGDVLGSMDEDRLSLFRRLAHLVTTRSDVFEIICVGQATAQGRVVATQRIVTVVQRQ